MMNPEDTANDTREYPCLLRVTDGGKNNFSTHVRIRSSSITQRLLIDLYGIGQFQSTAEVPRGVRGALEGIDDDPSKTRQEAREDPI